jgi:hypothetical protein
MKMILSIPMLAFGDRSLNSTGTIPKGEYRVEAIPALDQELKWYRVIGIKKIIGVNPKNLPREISFVD